jgi:hypothetical protein
MTTSEKPPQPASTERQPGQPYVSRAWEARVARRSDRRTRRGDVLHRIQRPPTEAGEAIQRGSTIAWPTSPRKSWRSVARLQKVAATHLDASLGKISKKIWGIPSAVLEIEQPPGNVGPL